MKVNYKNWMPKGMVLGNLAVTCVLIIVTVLVGLAPIGGKVLLAVTVISGLMTIWTILMYRAFSYNGSRKMSKQIIEGVSSYIKIPDGGIGLDVGCGSAALTNACAKKNPTAKMIGVDRWGKLLETLRTLKKGGTFAIHDIMSKSKYGDMEEFAKKLKDMGYEEVKLIDTTNGMFMSKWESIWMGLSGSTILMGRK